MLRPSRALPEDFPLPDDYRVSTRMALIAALFTIGGGVVTAPFSLSITRLMTGDTFVQALAKGLVIPTFTWAVQLTLAALLFRGVKRYEYAVQLGSVCTLGAAALWPAALYNTIVAHPSPWVSAANVYASVFLMFMELRRRNLILGLPAYLAPVFLVTIHINMAIFATSVLTPILDGFFHRF
jgi:hypothetical protein